MPTETYAPPFSAFETALENDNLGGIGCKCGGCRENRRGGQREVEEEEEEKKWRKRKRKRRGVGPPHFLARFFDDRIGGLEEGEGEEEEGEGKWCTCS